MSRRLFNPCRAFPALAGLLFASCILGQAQTAGVIAHPTQVSVGGQTLTLAAGQPVTVMSASGNTATVRVVLANGTVAMLQVPASALTSAQFSPSHATTPPTTLRVSTPLPPAPRPVTPAAMLATPEVDTKPGWRHLKFRELPVPPDKPPFLNYTFTPKDERFEVYIPRTYRPDRPCGLLGWITPSDEIPTPRRFAPLFDEFRLIVLSAARCGNDAETDRRLGAAVEQEPGHRPAPPAVERAVGRRARVRRGLFRATGVLVRRRVVVRRDVL